ncbi:hypothetical protein TUM12370_01600 [Salmonella enterica subsp. enterica serovar Choleraesuis]|nr:hypothetical protein TUM12370_01600 [Salmonella enterica subsp. enterica serovar Choleraesuis]
MSDVYQRLPSEEEIIILASKVIRKSTGRVNNKDLISFLLLKLETEVNPDIQDVYRNALQKVVYMTPDDI